MLEIDHAQRERGKLYLLLTGSRMDEDFKVLYEVDFHPGYESRFLAAARRWQAFGGAILSRSDNMRIALKNTNRCHCGACEYRDGRWGSEEGKIEELAEGSSFTHICTGCYDKLGPGDDDLGGTMGPADDEDRQKFVEAMKGR